MQWNRPMYTQIGQNAKSYQRHQQPLSKPRDSSPMLPSRDYGNYYNKCKKTAVYTQVNVE